MKKQYKSMTAVAVCVLILAAAAPYAQTDLDKLEYPKLNELKIPQIERVTLDNGMRLYLVEDKSLPVFNLSARINAGSYLEEAEQVGLVSIVGQVLRTGGTEKWSGDEIDEKLEAVGASVETGGGLAYCEASVDVLSEYTDLGLEVLAEILRHPVFDEGKIDLAKVQQRTAISRRNDQAPAIAGREFDKIIYGAESVYARHTEYKTIEAVTRDNLLAFHNTFIRPENTQMAIWGDFDKEGIVAKIKEYFGTWERGTTPVPWVPEVNYEFESGVFGVNKTDVNQSQIYVGHIGGLVTDEDYAARIVMNRIMGGGYGNRMFNAVRTREGLAYTAYADYNSNISYPGQFFAYAATKSESTGKAILEMIKVIESMQTDPPTDQELRQAIDGYLNSFVFKFDSKAEVVNRIMTYDRYGLPDDFLQQLKEKIESVSAADVVEAAKKNLRPDKLKVLVVGKTEDFDIPLAELGLGPVINIDVTIPSGEVERELAITPENLSKGAELLQEAVTAHGGLDNFRNIRSTAASGTMTLIMRGQELPLQIEEIEVLPAQTRTVVSFMGQTMYNIRDNGRGWKTDQTTGDIVEKSPDDLLDDDKEASRNLISIFQNSEESIYQAVYDGQGEANGTSVEHVVLLDAEGGTICRLGIDSSTKELVCKEYWGATPMGEGNIEELYAELTLVEGVRIPMQITRSMEGQKIGSMTYSVFEINGDIPADSFAPPE